MADRGHYLAGVEKAPDDLNRLRLKAQLVGVDLTARQHQRVVVGDVDHFEVLVHRGGLAPIGLIPAVDLSALLARLGRSDLDRCTSVRELLLRDEQLGLLEAVRGQDEDFGLLDVRHGSLQRMVDNARTDAPDAPGTAFHGVEYPAAKGCLPPQGFSLVPDNPALLTLHLCRCTQREAHVIRATCHTVDDALTVDFDATPWFQAADPASILHVAGQGWSSTWIADGLEKRPGYERLHELIDYTTNRLGQESLEDPAWATFECTVNGLEAIAWLDENRPDVAAAIRSRQANTAHSG